MYYTATSKTHSILVGRILAFIGIDKANSHIWNSILKRWFSYWPSLQTNEWSKDWEKRWARHWYVTCKIHRNLFSTKNICSHAPKFKSIQNLFDSQTKTVWPEWLLSVSDFPKPSWLLPAATVANTYLCTWKGKKGNSNWWTNFSNLQPSNQLHHLY